MQKHKILVLDGDHKNALAIIRHLGRTGRYIIDAASFHKHSLGFYSKYTSKKFITANPKKDPEQYIADLVSVLQKGYYLTVIPVSYISYQLCSAAKELLSAFTHLTIPSEHHIDIASSKLKTYRLAHQLGVPHPPVTEIKNVEEIEKVEVEFPCVIKAAMEMGKNLVDYVSNRDELITKYRKMCSGNDFKGMLPIVQKYIQGEGAGFFAFYKKGECTNFFMHQRVREYPVKGGASVVARSFYNEQVYNDGKKILDALQWEGMAMVEFKKDNKTGIYNLMEINAKFWGSLDLALAAGMDFPQMLIEDALGQEIAKREYRDIRFQWILNGDLFHVLERPGHVVGFFGELFRSKNDFWLRDLKPNIFQLFYVPVHFWKKWRD
jgi:predicted ATP-grasp superfamily ATP-dependent carboligase